MEFTYSPKQTDRLLLNLPSWAHLTANHFLGVGWLTAVKCPASCNGPGVHSIHYTTTSKLFLNVKEVHNYCTTSEGALQITFNLDLGPKKDQICSPAIPPKCRPYRKTSHRKQRDGSRKSPQMALVEDGRAVVVET